MSADDKTPGKRKRKAASAKFPLTLHPRGVWCKKILGRVHYFGRDRDEALKEWLRVKDDLLAGRPRREDDSGKVTLQELCNRFLDFKRGEVEGGELVQVSWDDYRREAKRMLQALGRDVVVDQLTEADFTKLRKSLARGISHKTLEGRVARCRAVFRFGERRRLIGPVSHKMEDSFRKPSRKVLDVERGDAVRAFEPSEIHLLLASASPMMKAAILLGLNCAFGPQDIAQLTLANLDLEGGWISMRRSKTGKARRAALWQETVAAVRAVLETREGLGPNDRVFVNRSGQPLNGVTKSRKRSPDGKRAEVAKCNPLSGDFLELRNAVGITGREKAFYSLRRTAKTVAENRTTDPVAVDHVLGHVDRSVSGSYRQYLSDDRLRAVAVAIHGWLFAEQSAKPE